MKKYYVGKSTEVYYNPAQPKESGLSRGPSFWFTALFILVIFLGVLGSFTIYCSIEDEGDFWSFEQMQEKWVEFKGKGPEYAIALKNAFKLKKVAKKLSH